MNAIITTALKAVNGGLFVVVFALLGEVATPKRFAGLFSAAPSIALANLAIIAIVKGPHDAQEQSTGMIIGAVALTAACAIGVVAVARWHALRGALSVCGLWLGIAVAGWWVVLR